MVIYECQNSHHSIFIQRLMTYFMTRLMTHLDGKDEMSLLSISN